MVTVGGNWRILQGLQNEEGCDNKPVRWTELMTWCRDAINSLFSILKTTELVDVFDILVLSYLVYWVIKLVRETRAGQLMKGIVLLFLLHTSLQSFYR